MSDPCFELLPEPLQKVRLHRQSSRYSERNTSMNISENPNSFRPSETREDTAAAYTQPVLLSDLPTHRAEFSRIGLSVLMLILGYQLFSYAASYAVGKLAPATAQTWWFTWALTDVSLYGVGLSLMWLVLRHIPAAPFNRYCNMRNAVVEKPHFGLGQWLVIAVIGMGAMEFGGIIGQRVMDFLSLAVGYDYANQLETVIGESPLWVSVIGTVVIAPLGEEFIFRKILIDRTRRWGDTVSILLSGALFGLFHGNLFQLFYTAMFGMLLAYVYTRTGQLRWCVGLHALVNFIGGIVPTLLREWIGTDAFGDSEKLMDHLMQNPLQLLVYMQYVLLLYLFMAAAVVLVICLRKRIYLGNGLYALPAGYRFRTVILNPGMIVSLLALLLILLSALILPPLTARLTI